MTEYVLHHAPDNASLPVRLALEEIGASYRIALVDRATGANRRPDYLALNPHGLIPVLETGDGPIFETGAILLWLADRHGMLAPAPGSQARGAFLKWFFFVANTLHADLVRLFHIERYGPQGALDAMHAASSRLIAGHWARLEAGLSAERAAPSEALDAIDLYIGPLARWSALFPADRDRAWFDLDALPAIRAALARCEARGSVQRCAEADGMGAHPFTRPHPATPAQRSIR